MKQLYVASTLYQILCLAAGIDEGKTALSAGAEEGAERILVLTNAAQVPELATPLPSMPGFPALAARFDRVVDLSELLWPRRPGQFAPRDEDLLVWERLLRSHWKLGVEPVQLILESVQVNPAIALSRIFASAPITVHSDGLMSYGPTRNPLPRHMAQRLDALVYVDLVPGLEPVLLREHGPARVIISRNKVRDLVMELASQAAAEAAPLNGHQEVRTALVLGQYLADLGLLTPPEEHEQQRRMLIEAAARGAEVCIYKPHPSASPGAASALEKTAATLGMKWICSDTQELAEVLIARERPDVVVGGFSTALVTAWFLFDVGVVSVGTDLMLERLSPYQNSNRVPVTIIDAVFVRGFDAPDYALPHNEAAPLQQLVDAVAYCMQPNTLAELHPQAERFLAVNVEAGVLRYFKRRRLTVLGLPGSMPVRGPTRTLRRVPRRIQRFARNMLTTARR